MDGNTAADLDVLTEAICEEVLAPLPRRDQRRRGVDYVRGLVTTSGRKSIRSIGLACAGPAGDQGLHHLVSGSTWDWGPIRRALRDHVAGATPVRAWVPRAVTMPRTGRHAVGQRHMNDGRAASVQCAVGLWAVSPDLVTPVEWRLRLDGEWLDDVERRRRASVPDDIGEESDTDAVAAVCAAAGTGHPPAPVVVDASDVDLAALWRALGRSRRPVLARIDPETPVLPADARAGADEVAAGRLLTATATPRVVAGEGPTGWVGAVRVRTRSPIHAVGSTRGDRSVLMVGSGRAGRREPTDLWLTDLVDEAPERLLALGGALDAVRARERAGTTAAAGVGHYGGRSYEAWHRHTTLASIAHLVREHARSVPARTGPGAGRRQAG